MSNRKYDFTALGFNLTFAGPDTAVAIENAIGKPGACEDAYMQVYAYHNRGPAFRKAYAEALAKETGIERKTRVEKAEGKEDKTINDETEQEFLNRVYATEGAITEADALALAQTVNDALGDWSPVAISDRKPAKPFYDKADEALAAITNGKSTPERITTNIEAKLGIVFVSQYGEFTRDNLARAMKALDEKARQDASNVL